MTGTVLPFPLAKAHKSALMLKEPLYLSTAAAVSGTSSYTQRACFSDKKEALW